MMRSILRRVAVICFCLFFAAPAFASVPLAPVEVDARLSKLSLSSQLELLEDPTGDLGFDAVRQSGNFKPAPAKGANIGFSRSAWWVRITLDNTDARDLPLVLRQDYPLIDHIDLWAPGRDGAWREIRTGDRRVFSTREFRHRDFLFALDLPASSQRTYYMRFASSGPIDISLSLYEPRTLLGAISSEQLAYGAYYGGFLMLVLYNFFIFVVVRDRAFFFYLLYAVSYGLYFAVFNGLSFQFLWPNSPVWANQSLLVLLSSTLIFGLQFTRTLLDTRTKSPRMDRLALALLGFSGLALAVSFFLPYSTLIMPLALLTVLVTVAILSLGILGMIDGYRPALYFMIAWAMLLLGVLVYMLKTFGLLPHNIITQNGFQFGSLAEMGLLSIALASRVNEIQRQARTDSLTNLFNRRFFDERVAFEFERSQRNHSPFALLVADIDHFKQFNDRFGHLRGDDVLKTVARHLREGVRGQDTVCRYGGEEFALILPGMNGAQAAAVAEALRAAVESASLSVGKVTISVGVACPQDQSIPNVDELFRAADSALYQAKIQGRNRVVRYAASQQAEVA
jgi:diguanylate cyclase (GGDEF)-like protein